jgi:membrane protein
VEKRPDLYESAYTRALRCPAVHETVSGDDAAPNGDVMPQSAASARHRSVNGWLSLVKKAASAWVADYAPSMGAALSYYSVFSLAPLLLIVISVAGLIFGQDAVRGELFGQLSGLLGADAAQAIEGLLASVSKPAEGIASTVIGIVLLLIGATTVFGELQDALDRIWRAPARDRTGGLWGLVRARLLSFGMILGIAFLLMVSLVFSAAVAALGKWWSAAFGSWEVLAQLVNLVLGFVMSTGIFAMIYKIMPRVRVQWRDVWIGAVVTALLFTIGRFLIGLYIGKSGVASGFGAAGSLIVVFIWVYYSAQIFLIGAEFTWVYATTFGSMRELLAKPEDKTVAELPNAVDAPSLAGQPTVSPHAVAPGKPAPHEMSLAGRTGAALAAGMGAGFVLSTMWRTWLDSPARGAREQEGVSPVAWSRSSRAASRRR